MNSDYFRKTGMQLVVGLVTSMLLLLLSGIGWIAPVYSAGNYVLEPMQYWSRQVVAGIDDGVELIANIGSLKSKSALLEMQVDELKAELASMKEVRRENDTLRAQLGIDLTKEWKLEQVRILGVDTFGAAEHIIIDGGSDDDISIGDVVILGDALVGDVRDVYASTSRVRLISNQTSNVYALDQETRAKGLVHGSLDGIVMEEVLENENLNVGDTVLSWEDDIPGGLVIGEITEVEDVPTSSTKRAFLRPAFNLSDVRYVFVVTEY